MNQALDIKNKSKNEPYGRVLSAQYGNIPKKLVGLRGCQKTVVSIFVFHGHRFRNPQPRSIGLNEY